MPPSASATPKRSQAFKRPAPSDGFPDSPVPSKLRNPRGTPRQTIGHPGSITAATAGSTVVRRTRGGSRLASVASTNGYDDGFGYERHASVGLGSVTSEFAARHQVPRYGLARGAVLAKDQVYKVFATGDIPVDVWNVMQSFDASTDAPLTRAYIDPSIGWALLSTATTTYVWNHAKRTSSASPTCYTFPHTKTSRRAVPPLTALVQHGHASAGSEPGVLFVYPATGRISCWDRVAMVLANTASKGPVKGRIEAGVELADGEVINGLTKLERDLFLLTTSTSRAFRLSLSLSSGQPTLTLKPFEITTRKIFIASSTTPYLFPPAHAGAEGIKSVAVGEAMSPSKGLVKGLVGDATRDVWLLTDTHCQRWTVGAENQKIHSQFNLSQILVDSTAFLGTVSGGAAAHELPQIRSAMADSLQLLNISAFANGRIAALVSYTLESDARDAAFAVVVLREDAMMADNLVVENSVLLDYREAASSYNRVTRPALVVPKHGRFAFVKFMRAIVTCSLADGLPYQQIALLHADSANAFIGTGSVLDVDPSQRHVADNAAEELSQFYTFLPQSGIICLEASVDALLKVGQNVDMFTPNALLKTRLEQAVFFSDSRNPLTFDLQPGYSGSIETAALEVSESIVSSTYSDQSPHGDMAHEFEKRLRWLNEIIHFFQRNDVLKDVSRDAKQRLLVDLQTVSSGAGLWTFLNVKGRLSMLGSGNYLSFLGDAILEWAEEHSQPAEHEDVVRSFFKHYLSSLPDVLHRARNMLQQRADSIVAIAVLSEWQLGVNEAFLIAFEAALIDDMAERVERYGLDLMKAVSTRLWLTDEAIVDDLKYVYRQSVQLLQARSGHFGSAIDDSVEAQDEATLDQQRKQQVLKDQISRMVYPLCYALEACARYAAHEIEQQPDQRGAIKYQERYQNDMQEAIVALTNIDVELAYHMAEHHLHYAALVYLATHEQFGSPDRLEQYMQGHIGRAHGPRMVNHQAGRFAQQLYSMYYNQDRYFELLNQRPEYYPLLSDFFRRQGAPKLAWIHDINMGKFDKAGEALIQASLEETRLHGQQVMLSISKLSLVADNLKRFPGGPPDEDRQQTLDLIEDRLELGAKTERVVKMILDVARPTSSLQHVNVDKVVQRYMTAKSQNLGDYPYHIELFRKIATDAMSGLAISHEDLADLLSLKDNADEEIEDYVEAVQVCRVIPKPEGSTKNRQTTCLRSLWRRIWLHDDWTDIPDTSKQTDEEVQERRTATAAFQLIKATREGDLPKEYMLSPEIAATPPTEAELRARFGPAADIQGLLEEQTAEAERLQSLADQGVFADFLSSYEA